MAKPTAANYRLASTHLKKSSRPCSGASMHPPQSLSFPLSRWQATLFKTAHLALLIRSSLTHPPNIRHPQITSPPPPRSHLSPRNKLPTMSKVADQPPSYSTLMAPFLQSSRVCCITLNETDKIRLIGTPPEITHAVRLAIRQGWGAIQREQNYSGAHEFKLLGNPWHGQSEEAVRSRKLITAVLRAMANYGWNLIQAADVSKKQSDKDSLFFELGPVQDPQADLFSISFNRSDRIRVIDAPHMVPYVKQAIQTQWKYGLQMEQQYAGAHEFKLSGNPFYSDWSEAVYARMLLSQILANLRSQGYKLYTSVDISIGTDGMDLESWVFRRVGPAWS